MDIGKEIEKAKQLGERLDSLVKKIEELRDPRDTRLDTAYAIISNALEQTDKTCDEWYCAMTCEQNRKPDGCPWFYDSSGFRCYRNDAQHFVEIMENGDE